MALASIDETENHLGEALEARYIGPAEYTDLLVLIKRARIASQRLLAYLEQCPDPRDRPQSPKAKKIDGRRAGRPRT